MKKAFPLLIALVCAAAVVLLLRSGNQAPAAQTIASDEKASSHPKSVVVFGTMGIDDAKSSPSDKAQGKEIAVAKDLRPAAPPKTNDPFSFGKTPMVRGDSNETVRSVVEAVRNNTNPEQLSALGSPKSFDLAAYRANPKAYLSIVEPARALRPAQPGPDVVQMRTISPRLQNMEQGQSVSLRVQAVPNVPVTFTSFDCGRFEENKLTTVTVEANAQGVASATFHAPAGTIENVNILAASPVTSGQAKYIVHVTRPTEAVQTKN